MDKKAKKRLSVSLARVRGNGRKRVFTTPTTFP